MASVATITPPVTGAADFVVNGTHPFYDENAREYIEAAHAVTTFVGVAAGEHGSIHSSDTITIKVFDAVSLLLAHAVRILDKAEA